MSGFQAVRAVRAVLVRRAVRGLPVVLVLPGVQEVLGLRVVPGLRDFQAVRVVQAVPGCRVVLAGQRGSEGSLQPEAGTAEREHPAVLDCPAGPVLRGFLAVLVVQVVPAGPGDS
jgi:hypothetical protein